MTILINELLRYAEIEAEEESEVRTTDVGEAVAEVLENLKVEMLRSGAEVCTDELPLVSARPAGLVLLFQNLIVNAIHYCRDEPPRVRIEVSDADDAWLFRVIDNGAGIRPEDQSRVFQMFARAHEDLRPRGTGIGLAMCRRIVENFGGRIGVESQPGLGSTFFFTLPKAEGVVEQPRAKGAPAPV
jgi:signal transduction histidine kinase